MMIIRLPLRGAGGAPAAWASGACSNAVAAAPVRRARRFNLNACGRYWRRRERYRRTYRVLILRFDRLAPFYRPVRGGSIDNECATSSLCAIPHRREVVD